MLKFSCMHCCQCTYIWRLRYSVLYNCLTASALDERLWKCFCVCTLVWVSELGGGGGGGGMCVCGHLISWGCLTVLYCFCDEWGNEWQHQSTILMWYYIWQINFLNTWKHVKNVSLEQNKRQNFPCLFKCQWRFVGMYQTRWWPCIVMCNKPKVVWGSGIWGGMERRTAWTLISSGNAKRSVGRTIIQSQCDREEWDLAVAHDLLCCLLIFPLLWQRIKHWPASDLLGLLAC